MVVGDSTIDWFKDGVKFRNIPKFYNANYRVSISWTSVDSQLEKYHEYYNLDVNPDFQRGHVWSEEKQIAYVEYGLRGGPSSREIQFNCTNWDHHMGDMNMVLVDGKQRLTAIQKFIHGKIPAFGYYFSEFEDKIHWCDHCLLFFVNNLSTREQVLEWYLQINTGGVVHSEEEIEKVRRLLEAERANKVV